VPHRPRFRIFVLGFAAAGGGATVFASARGETKQASAPTNTAKPVVSGAAATGSTLTTSAGTWDGTAPITFTYRWQRCDSAGANCVTIAGATDDTYTVASPDVGHRLRTVVRAKNSAGQTDAASDPTTVVGAAAAPQNTSVPTIGGSATVGATLTTTNGNWSGSTPITYTYDWQRCDTSGNSCANIDLHSDNQTYVVASDDAGHTLRAVVTATNSIGHSAAASAATSVVIANGPVNTTSPSITGNAAIGQALTTSNGAWTSATTVTYAYAWSRCDTSGNNCNAISGATSATYVVVSDDAGHTLRSQVTATNASGSTKATSNAVGPVASTPIIPPGGSVPASSISDTDRLTIAAITYSGGGFHGRGPITASFKVMDANQHVVSGALVYVLPAPREFGTHPGEVPTAANGWASVQLALTSKAPRSGWLLLFVRARTPQGNLLAGSSARRLVQVHISR
jgi:large repetitive protein